MQCSAHVSSVCFAVNAKEPHAETPEQEKQQQNQSEAPAGDAGKQPEGEKPEVSGHDDASEASGSQGNNPRVRGCARIISLRFGTGSQALCAKKSTSTLRGIDTVL